MEIHPILLPPWGGLSSTHQFLKMDERLRTCGCGQCAKMVVFPERFVRGHNAKLGLNMPSGSPMLNPQTVAKATTSNAATNLKPEVKRRRSASAKESQNRPEVRCAISLALTGRTCSKETRDKISSAKKGSKQTSEHKEAIAAGQLRAVKKPSSLELRLSPVLKPLGFQPQVRIAWYKCDFVHEGMKVVVEAQGCWDHCCQSHHPVARTLRQKSNLRNDKAKRTYLTDRGWTVLYVWEHESNEEAKRKLFGMVTFPYRQKGLSS